VDVREVSLAEVRRRVGMVKQEVQLFNASVRDNLTFFDDTVHDGRLLEAIHSLGLTPWLESLPAGLETELGPSGGGLSAGQAQLLALVRVFLCDPGLLVLDEASSRLDPATERLVREAVDRMLRGRTAVVIAHRLETVQRADEIGVLDNGQLVEFGPQAALAADPSSHYARLLRTGLAEVTPEVTPWSG
jgi:ATP-binding cassette subfamily B protein